MQNSPHSALMRYGGAAIVVALATAARIALDPVLGNLFPFATLFLAVLVVAGYSGRGPALLATGLGAVTSAFLLLPPRNPLSLYSFENRAGLALYLVVGVGVALLGGALRGARWRAEAEAAEAARQREQLQITLASIGDAVLVTDAEGRVASMNPVAEALTGWPSAEAMGQPLPSVFRIVNEETRREVENPALRALREGAVVGLANHTVLIARDGAERAIDDSAAPIRDASGAVRGAVLVFRDVDERRRAEASERRLQAEAAMADAKFRAFFDQGPLIAAIMALDGTLIEANRRSLEACGYARGEVVGRPFWECPWWSPSPDLVGRVRAASEQAATGETFRAEIPYFVADGTERVADLIVLPIRDGDGRVAFLAPIGTDITDRKRAEGDARFLAEASATLAAIVDEADTLQKVAHLAVPSFADWCAVDLIGEGGLPRRLAVAHVDPAKVDLAHDVQPRYPPDLDAPGGVPHVIRTGESLMVSEITDEMIDDGARDRDHLRILRELGLKSYLGAPLRGRDGTLGAITFVAAESGRRYDQRDLRMAEDLASRAAIALDNARLLREVRESEGRFRQLADAMPQIVWTARPDGHVDYFNRRWYEFTGRPEGEDGQGSWSTILHPDDLPPCLVRWGEAVASGQPYEFEHRFRDHSTGEYRWHLGRALPVRDESGKVVRWFGTATDIDDRKRAEGALRAARDEAEEANRAKTQFLAVLSHELRTPLNPILLATSSMLDRPAEPDEVRPTLEMIRQNVNLQARLIDDLLDVMRIVRGKMPLHWEVADAHALIHHAVQICRSEVAGGGLRLETDLAAGTHHIDADPARWQQVIWNLVKNAVKFTPAGGSITVRTRNEGGDIGQGERLVIEVSDTGIGIEPEILHRIFDPFQQGETTITRKFGGLGLGLAICRGIVEGLGGTISARSEGEGLGTTFRVELPALPEPDPRGHDRATSWAPGSDPTTPRRILVVEDEPATLRLMARLLAGLGHEVMTAASIREAMDRVEAVDFELIVSDIGLPDGSGLDLMRRIVASRGPLPAIALTGYGMEDDIQRSREAGFSAHMTKPIDFRKLEAMIRRVSTGNVEVGPPSPVEEGRGP